MIPSTTTIVRGRKRTRRSSIAADDTARTGCPRAGYPVEQRMRV